MSNWKTTALLIACSVALTSWVPASSARTLRVCKTNCTYSSVQRAIDTAASGDTINIGTGTYFENLVIVSKKLTIIGAGEDFTVLDGGFRDAVIHVGAEAVSIPKFADLTLYAVTVTHGGQGGIAVHGGSLNLQSSAVVSNRMDTVDPVCGEGGGGIVICAANATIGKSIITHNETGGQGGGVFAVSESNITIKGCTISRNTAGEGGGIGIEESNVTLGDSALSDNTARGSGGAISITPTVPFVPGGTLNMSTTSVVHNHAGYDGGGIWGVEIQRFRIAAFIDDSVIARNDAVHEGGGLAGDFNFGNDFVVQNSAGSSGGGIELGPTATSLAETGSTFASNTPDNCAGPPGACPAH